MVQYKIPDISEMRKVLSDIKEDRHCITDRNTLSPFLNPPYDDLRPGVMSDAALKFHELYPEIFRTSRTGFMGSKYSGSWEGDYDLIYYSEGHFDPEGRFHAPIAVYRSLDTFREYILFQQGSYQVLCGDAAEQIENGKLAVHRGIRNATGFITPEIGDERLEGYMKYLAGSFVSPVISLGYNIVSRGETDYMKLALDSPVFDAFHADHDYHDLEQSFTIDEHYIASRKFGPNYVSFETPLDNLRIITEWTGEEEVYVLDFRRAVRIR